MALSVLVDVDLKSHTCLIGLRGNVEIVPGREDSVCPWVSVAGEA